MSSNAVTNICPGRKSPRRSIILMPEPHPMTQHSLNLPHFLMQKSVAIMIWEDCRVYHCWMWYQRGRWRFWRPSGRKCKEMGYGGRIARYPCWLPLCHALMFTAGRIHSAWVRLNAVWQFIRVRVLCGTSNQQSVWCPVHKQMGAPYISFW